MGKRLGIVAALVALFAGWVAPAGAIRLPDPNQAIAVVEAFHAALRTADTPTALALLDENVLIYEEGGVERSRAEYAKEHLPADMAFSSAVATSVVDRQYARIGDLFWVATWGRAQGRFRGRAVDRLTTETMVLKRTPEGWRIVHIHWSSKAPQ